MEFKYSKFLFCFVFFACIDEVILSPLNTEAYWDMGEVQRRLFRSTEKALEVILCCLTSVDPSTDFQLDIGFVWNLKGLEHSHQVQSHACYFPSTGVGYPGYHHV